MPGALDRLATTAKNLIQKYGSSAVLKQRVSGGKYDPSRMKKRAVQLEDVPIVCTPPQRATGMSDGNTPDYNFTTFVSPFDANPDLLETLVFKGAEYKVVMADPIYSGEVIAVYEMMLEG